MATFAEEEDLAREKDAYCLQQVSRSTSRARGRRGRAEAPPVK